MAVSSCNGSSRSASLALHFFAPVSVGLRTIETGAAILAQRQGPWAFRLTHGRHKSRETRLFGGDIREDVAARA
jgi:hypothetical protein